VAASLAGRRGVSSDGRGANTFLKTRLGQDSRLQS